MQKKITNKKTKKPKAQRNIPAAIPQPVRNKAAQIQSLKGQDGRVTVRHREYLGDVVAHTLFEPAMDAIPLPINPGISSAFPWLSNMANNYEFYQFSSLTYEYHPICGTTTNGSLMMALDYDVLDDAPVNKQRMMSYMGAVQGPMYSPLRVTAPAAALRRFGSQHYTRPGALPANADKKTYDVGNLFIYSDGGIGNTTGSLYVAYEVQFSSPHSPATFPWEESAVIISLTSTKASPLNGATASCADVLDPIVEINNPSSFYLEAGEYIIDLFLGGAGIAAAALPTILTFVEPSTVATALDNIVNGAQSAYNGNMKIKCLVRTLVTAAIPVGWTTLSSFGLRVSPFAYSL